MLSTTGYYQSLCCNASFAPSGLAVQSAKFTHGLRRGLYSCAASRLFWDLLLHYLLASKVATSLYGIFLPVCPLNSRTSSDCREGLIQVVHDVVHIFDSDGDADQAVGDSDFSSSLFAQRGVSHGGGMRD